MFGLAFDFGGFPDSPSEAVIAVGSHALKLAVAGRFRFNKPISAAVTERLRPANNHPLFDQIAPRIVGIFLIEPALDAVVVDLFELAGVEVQSARCWVVPELFAVDESPRAMVNLNRRLFCAVNSDERSIVSTTP